MSRYFFFFIHIPKCGGTSFDSILIRNLRNQFLFLPHQLYEGPIDSFNLKLYINENNNRMGIG